MTPEFILQVTSKCSKPWTVADKLGTAMRLGHITSPRRIALFLAQLEHECPGLNPTEEKLNYSARRLPQVWPSRFPTEEIARRYAGNPEALANRVYANRMGNGDEASGDGWRYRGRGFIQLTGKENYERFGRLIDLGVDLVRRPDLALEYGVGAHIAVAYWVSRGCNELADRGDVEGVTRRINGGIIGLADRTRQYRRILALLGQTAPVGRRA